MNTKKNSLFPHSLIALCFSVLSVKRSRSLAESLQVLSQDDSLHDDPSDPVLTRGAYLSLIYLRHLKLRELQVQ